jgi:Tfp pilus assembly pilus retraction ATPase PilT
MDLYEATAQQLIGQVIEGYNGTIFAYGQTGSGKTYTMMGVVRSEEEQGIIPRTFEQLVTTIKSKSNKNFLIQCSYMEIYNEEIYDLLSGNLKNRL